MKLSLVLLHFEQNFHNGCRGWKNILFPRPKTDWNIHHDQLPVPSYAIPFTEITALNAVLLPVSEKSMCNFISCWFVLCVLHVLADQSDYCTCHLNARSVLFSLHMASKAFSIMLGISYLSITLRGLLLKRALWSYQMYVHRTFNAL